MYKKGHEAQKTILNKVKSFLAKFFVIWMFFLGGNEAFDSWRND